MAQVKDLIVNGTARVVNKVIANNVTASSVTDSGLTASRALISDANKNLSSSSTTSTELGYVHGVTSAIQTQLDNKGALVTSWSTDNNVDTKYPSAKLVYDTIGDVETLLAAI